MGSAGSNAVLRDPLNLKLGVFEDEDALQPFTARLRSSSASLRAARTGWLPMAGCGKSINSAAALALANVTMSG
jgi:hypothetical protein